MRKLKKQIKQEAEEVSEALIRIVEKFVNLLINVRLPKFRNPFTLLKVSFIAILLFVSTVGSNSYSDISQGASAMETHIDPQRMYISSLRNNFEDKLTKEVNEYIKEVAPTSRLDASHIVKKCLEYETDIVFVLAQGLLESHFGTKGKAASTNSVWNVGTFDDGTILYRYKTPDESLEPYLKLLKEDYLINITHAGDTIQKEVQELVMEDRQYINYDGKRFASARGYENAMRKLMVRIDMETSISFYQKILSLSNEEMISYFAPIQTSLNPESFQAMNF